jgi:hypothetical protein
MASVRKETIIEFERAIIDGLWCIGGQTQDAVAKAIEASVKADFVLSCNGAKGSARFGVWLTKVQISSIIAILEPTG